MNKLLSTCAVTAALALSACSCLPPQAEQMSKLPVVRFGDAAPAGAPFVTLLPAGTSLPVVASVTGSLLDKTATANLSVTLKRDVYLYDRWVSFDGKTWQSGRNAVANRFVVAIPGVKTGSNPGELGATFDLK